MARHLCLDVRNLDAAATREHVAAAIGAFAEGDTLKLLTNCDPRSLYPMLERGGFSHHSEPGSTADYEVTIWPAAA